MTDGTPSAPRVCAWTGEEFSGKGYLLPTTEPGVEVVSARALTAALDARADETLADLEYRVRALEFMLTAAGDRPATEEELQTNYPGGGTEPDVPRAPRQRRKGGGS